VGETLGDGLAIHLAGQPRMRAMTRIVGTVAMAIRITASTTGPGNRLGAKVFQFRNLPQDCGTLLFLISERHKHRHLKKETCGILAFLPHTRVRKRFGGRA
jgi:hypothetical protein